MRVLSLTLAAFAISAFAVAPASACEWMKSAQKDDLSITQSEPVAADISIATNDLSDGALEEMTLLPVPDTQPAE